LRLPRHRAVREERLAESQSDQDRRGAAVAHRAGPGAAGMSITDVAIDISQPWARRHLRAIELAYGRAAAWARYGDDIRAFYAQPWHALAGLAVANARWLARTVGIATPSRLASELTVTATDPTERLVELCRAV